MRGSNSGLAGDGMLHGRAVPTNGAERGVPNGSKKMGSWKCTDCESQRHVNTFTSTTPLIGIGGIRGASIGVGFPALSGVSYGRARPGRA